MHENSDAPDLLDVTLDDGKYRVVQRRDGRVEAYRHGKPWRELTGDGLMLMLAQELDRTRKQRDELLGVCGRLHACLDLEDQPVFAPGDLGIDDPATINDVLGDMYDLINDQP